MNIQHFLFKSKILKEKNETNKKNFSKIEMSDTLFYFSKSKDVAPGKGVNEYVSNPKIYSSLSKVKDWRKKLSNFSISEFKLDGLTWKSVEHYYQGSKFKKNNPRFYKQFSLESKSEISQLPEMAKSAGGKTGKYKGKLIRPLSIKMDSDYDFEKSMLEAMGAKFSQNEELGKILLMTKNAQLWHGTRGVPKHRVFILEKVRFCLKKSGFELKG